MNTKSKLKAISIGIAAIMMVSLFAVMTVSASVVTDCWIGDDDKVYFTIYSDAKAEGYASLYVDGAYTERKNFSLNSGDTKTLSFREYKWSGCEDVEVCVDNSCASPSVVVKSCWISAHYEVYFTVYSDAKAEGHALLYVNGKYTERRKYTLNAGETRTLSFDTYRWSHQCKDMEVCVDNSCCKCPCIWPLVPPTPSAPPSPRPDLVITDIRENDGTICFKIENWGTEEAESSYTSLYLNGAYQARRKVGSLAAGESTELCFGYVYTPDTDDIVKVCADSTNDVAESNEGNNCKELIPDGKPDLVIENKWEEWVPFNETHYWVTFVILNNGTAVAPAGHNARLYLDGSGKAMWGNLPALEPCKTITMHLPGFRAIECTGDNDTIKVCADADGGIDELDETNNCLENVWTCIPPPPSPGPDLVITDIRNNDGTICFAIKNQGTEGAGSSYAGLYLNGAYQERKKVGSLDSGESTELYFSYVYTPGTDDIVKVCADSGNDVAESNEGNNCKVWTCIPPRGEYWAVIVGVSNYADPSIHDLSYCDDDANDIYSRLLSYDNWKASNIMLLIDSAATKANIHNAIDWMKTEVDADDICLFLFSGHGARETDIPPYDEADGRDEYLCPHDSLLTSVTNDIRDDELDDWMTPIKGKKVVLLDTCFSGGFVKTPAYTIKTKPGIPYRKPTGKMLGDGFTKDLDKSGYVTLTASQDTEFSYECPALENGVFSYYVDEGLAGPANADDDRDISAEETYDYANPKVVSYYTEQHPQIYDGVTGELPVVKW